MKENVPPTLVDLFAGCGAVTEGFKKAGFNVLAAIEFDPATAETYRANHPEVDLIDRDIMSVHPQEVMTRNNLNAEELTVLSVCAPCQPFSRQNRKVRTQADARSHLVLKMLEFVAVMRPKFAVMENVPHMAKGKNKQVLTKLQEGLQRLDYQHLQPVILNTADYGVPQSRNRLILLASRDSNINLSLPIASHGSKSIAANNGLREHITVREAFQGLAHTRLRAGCQSRTDPLHRARQHSDLNMERLRHIPKNGGSRKSLPDHLWLDCHRNINGYQDVYGRMSYDKPATTLTTGCTNFTRGRFAHPTANRSISLREAARLQSFDDEYIFIGGFGKVERQIGNAVPVTFATAIANHFLALNAA